LPELAVLIGGSLGSLAPQPPPSNLLLQPAQRADLAPLGGRAGAAPYMMESWAPLEQSSGVMINPLLESSVGERRAAALPSWPVMFALAGGFAFLMSLVAILGARFLQQDEPGPAASAGAAGSPAVSAPQAKLQVPEEPATDLPDIGGVVISVDDPTQAARAGGARRGDAQAKGTKKQLTAEQREMLARMGGRPQDPAALLRARAARLDLDRRRAHGRRDQRVGVGQRDQREGLGRGAARHEHVHRAHREDVALPGLGRGCRHPLSGGVPAGRVAAEA
jgi:hypothetical protein